MLGWETKTRWGWRGLRIRDDEPLSWFDVDEYLADHCYRKKLEAADSDLAADVMLGPGVVNSSRTARRTLKTQTSYCSSLQP